MGGLDLAEFAALSFDCYATLIDWERGIETALRPWLERNRCTAESDQFLGLFAASESRRQSTAPSAPYPEILAGCFDDIAAGLALPATGGERSAFAESVASWPPFDDSAAALGYLKRHFKLVVVSNVDRNSFRHSNERLGVAFDLIVTAEDAGAYKPGPAHFRHVLDALAGLGIPAGAVLHIAQSLYHDHVPAKRLELKTVWVDRGASTTGWGATPRPDTRVEPDITVRDLAEFAKIHRDQTAGRNVP